MKRPPFAVVFAISLALVAVVNRLLRRELKPP